MKQREDETTIEFVRRLVGQLDYEDEGILMSLPSIESLIAYSELWATYNAEFMAGIRECIEEGADPKPLNDFIKKYKLDWTPQ